MRIGLIRHGETDWNAGARLQGQVDIPLNERGIEQAEDAGRMLRGHSWSVVLASPLGRAQHTAERIAAAIGVDAVGVVPGVVERSFGELEGVSIYLEDGTRRPLDHPSIESVKDVVERAIAAILETAQLHPNTDVLLVTHGSVIRLVLTELLQERAPHISNLGLSILETDERAPRGLRVVTANGYPIATCTLGRW